MEVGLVGSVIVIKKFLIEVTCIFIHILYKRCITKTAHYVDDVEGLATAVTWIYSNRRIRKKILYYRKGGGETPENRDNLYITLDENSVSLTLF
jgi:hypothetical protein